MKYGFQIDLEKKENDPDSWLPDFPNPPDLLFDYYKLMMNARIYDSGLGKGPIDDPEFVCIIGGGVAGIAAARELFRCRGYKIRIFEASDRLNGRLYTTSPDSGPTENSGMELGAMRMPFFEGGTTSDDAMASTNSLLSYYLNQDQGTLTHAEMASFPNPGHAPGGTGIFINDGYGPDGNASSPSLISWPDGADPDNPQLVAVMEKVNIFISKALDQIVPSFTGGVQEGNKTTSVPPWATLWKAICENYDKMSFADLVMAPTYDDNGGFSGWFGGMGMDDSEANLLYTIGTGDGSWGAFYSIGALWWMRCTIFGYGTNLQTVTGLSNASNLHNYNIKAFDSKGRPLVSPLYRGIQSLPEMLYYIAPYPSASIGWNLYDYSINPENDRVETHVNTTITKISKAMNGTITVTGKDNDTGISTDYLFSHVVITAPIWAVQTSIEFEGFSPDELPFEVKTAMHEQHLIGSCKVFYQLKPSTISEDPNAPYWDAGAQTGIPQILISDTDIQDAYGLQWSTSGLGALLASYTWEDDARKFISYSDQELGDIVLAKLDKITMSTIDGSPKISDYVDTSKPPTVWHWAIQPTYHGCGKLYRSRDFEKCYSLLTYNQEYSAKSGLYFAGESYSVEGGWTEPALRGAIDAVIHLIHNTTDDFTPGFTFSDYPKYDMTINPDETYPQSAP